ncbi:MAG: DUF702 domain-containing protein [Bradyrhizobiaceae bacterium]|nr:MAG: DUF702 domain-containing protein [Bradyrhizobiaceae bacterium]
MASSCRRCCRSRAWSAPSLSKDSWVAAMVGRGAATAAAARNPQALSSIDVHRA